MPLTRAKQAATLRCDCRRHAVVRQETPYEFTWACICRRAGVISWAHAHPPPQWDEVTVSQGDLFVVSADGATAG